MAWLSVARYRAYNALAFDLAVMSQAIWTAGDGQALLFTAEGLVLSRLARHAEVIYFAFAPLYRLFPTPAFLVVAQAAFYALGAVPAFRLARRKLGRDPALVVVAVYLLYPVLQTAVLADFHGDTLAVPFLLAAVEAADRRAWRGYAVWLALALLCKVYVVAPVAALGLVVVWRGDRRAGLATMVAAAAWGIIAFFGFKALFASPDAELLNVTAGSYLDFYFGGLREIDATAVARIANVLVVILPVSALAWRAPAWLLPAAVTIVPVVLSTGPGPSYDFRYHHYALGVPFLIVALIFAAESVRRRSQAAAGRWPWHLPLAICLLVTIIVNVYFVDSPLNPAFYRPAPGSGRGLDPAGYGRTPRDALKDAWLAEQVPPRAAVAANQFLVTHLANRPVLFLTDHEFVARALPNLLHEVDYVVVDALFDYALSEDGRILYDPITHEEDTLRLMLGRPDFQLVAAQDGLLLFGRQSAGLRTAVEVAPAAATPPLLARFGDGIGLVSAELISQGQRRYQAQFEWLALRPLAPGPRYVAVTRLEGLPQARVAHLPTMALRPTTAWQVGDRVRETFEFSLPDDTPPGRYAASVGWYDTDSLFAAATDERSRLGEEVVVGYVTVP
jgi:uncharacterized membrane protein